VEEFSRGIWERKFATFESERCQLLGVWVKNGKVFAIGMADKKLYPWRKS
jgi:hypothetical protein